ncbi:MAG: hypothetical protein AAGF67_12630, partial [Verrucomicrobiota bacterium]
MKKLKEELEDFPGFRMMRRCKGKQTGYMVLWDTKKESKVKSSKNGHRWCIQHLPEGKGKKTQMYSRTLQSAKIMLIALANDKDQWGFWETEDSKEGKNSEGGGAKDGSESTELSEGGAPIRPSQLTKALLAKFSDERVANLLDELCTATKPIYMNEGGNVSV